MSRPIHYFSEALHGLAYISNYGHLSMKWLKQEILGHKKGFVSRTFVKKVLCYFSFLFFSVLLTFFFFFSFFLSFFFFFYRKWAIFNRVLVPFFPRFEAKFLQYFSLATKKKKKKKMGSARIYRQAANVSPHTYARGFVRQTLIYLFIYFFSTLGITKTHLYVSL